jgi:hypothetical protein
VQNVTFDSDYCTVKLDFCGTFAVLQPGEANPNQPKNEFYCFRDLREPRVAHQDQDEARKASPNNDLL